ncbi:Flagellar biosynthesis protein FlgN [Methylophaga frappieri]|uniref:Flagellar biosynthesis protein FlgN n=1 Tax=Methylophaga frappieri (strain ATCC BAA-2434 / DSM 25690 / JAM7) TaxID=754477 RepID=I1YI58_METFJ|nr:flagellar protein FlgN [Methylophaga frappieri]AFJ02601.1 Flagellar biosynthesis protein FlgN [Methylophaga frappieri]
MTMTPAQQMQSTLKSESQIANEFANLLQVERQALMDRDETKLNHCLKQKQPLVRQLEALGRQRELILKQAGFPADRQGMAAFIANQLPAQAETLQKMLASLKQTAQACQQNNQINGGIVSVNRQYLQRAMSILRGRDPEASAYGPGGEYTSGVVRQPLIGRV